MGYNPAVSELEFSVVVPVHNERANLEPLQAAVVSVMERLGRPFEMLLVDDGSTDGSGELLDALAARDSRLRVLHFERNYGQSAALAAGFAYARGKVIITLDADLQNDPEDIPKLLPLLTEFDAVVGIRAVRHDSFWKRFSSRFANAVRNWLTREDIVDTGCPLKVFRAEAIKTIPMWNGAHRFLPTLLKLGGFRVTQVPVGHRPRHAGKSHYGTWDRAFRGLRDALGVRWLQDRALRWRVKP